MEQSDFTPTEIIPGCLTKKMQPVMESVDRFIHGYRESRGVLPERVVIRKKEYNKILEDVRKTSDAEVNGLCFRGVAIKPHAE